MTGDNSTAAAPISFDKLLQIPYGSEDLDWTTISDDIRDQLFRKSASEKDHNMFFAEGLSYQLPLQLTEDACIFDVGGQATISEHFNTMESIHIDPLDLHNDDVFWGR